MLEPWRSRYLQALGVDLYVPRVLLPGARPPLEPLWDPAALMPAPPPVPAVEEVRAAVAPVAPAREENPRMPVLELPVENARPAPASRPVKAAEPAPTATAGIRFALTVVQAEGLVIVDETPQGGARGEYQKLLGNLLFALQGRAPAFSVDQFHWPPAVKVPQLDQSENAARETLSAYLQKRLQAGADLLVLGENAGHWVSAELRGQLVQTPQRCGVSVVSLWACLREPTLKRQLWQDLRPLATQR